MQFDYMQTTLNRYTFSNRRIRAWVEENCKGLVLNLFAGETVLNINEIRNDLREEAPAHFHKDALAFVSEYEGEKFDTVLLDPPYSYRKSMEMYAGKITSPFNALKDGICKITRDDGIVITFGYHSVSMGKKRGFAQSKILLMSHGGAIHDTIAVIEKKEAHPCATGHGHLTKPSCMQFLLNHIIGGTKMLCEDKKCPVYIECMERLEALPYCASKAAELATTANQQLKAEISALVQEHFLVSDCGVSYGHIGVFVTKLRQLTAV